MRNRIVLRVCVICGLAFLTGNGGAVEQNKPLRAGIIGLDTSHVVEFTKRLNAANPPADLAGVRIMAGYPGGSPDMPLSWNRVRGFTQTLHGNGVEIVDSTDALLQRADVVFLESVDGRVHLAQARPVIAAGKPLFIDKPMASTLSDAMEIFRLAKEKNVPYFSASSLRFAPQVQAMRTGASGLGDVRACTASSPASERSLITMHAFKRFSLYVLDAATKQNTILTKPAA